MKQLIFLLVFGFSITSCSNYSLIDENSDTSIGKCIVNVRLKNKVDEKELTLIANKLRKSRTEFNNLWIFYYLPEMKIGLGAWATTHFMPNLEVKILGTTDEQGNFLDRVVLDEKEIIGKWRDYSPSMESVSFIFKDNDSLKIKMIFKDGSNVVNGIIKKNEKGKVIYNYSDTALKEYIVLEQNGDLSFFGLTGKYGEAKKIQ